jgi:hypothetical protein
MEQKTQDMGITGTSLEGPVDPNAYKYNVDYHRFSDYLGIDKYKREDRQLAGRVSLVYDWAKKQVGRDDREAITRAVREYARGLGTQLQGESLVDHLYNNIRLDMSGDNSEEVKAEEDEKIAEEKDKALKNKEDPVVEVKVGPLMKKIQKQVKKAVKKQIEKSVSEALQE